MKARTAKMIANLILLLRNWTVTEIAKLLTVYLINNKMLINVIMNSVIEYVPISSKEKLILGFSYIFGQWFQERVSDILAYFQGQELLAEKVEQLLLLICHKIISKVLNIAHLLQFY